MSEVDLDQYRSLKDGLCDFRLHQSLGGASDTLCLSWANGPGELAHLECFASGADRNHHVSISVKKAAELLGLDSADLPTWTQGVVITDASLRDNPIIYASQGFQDLTGYLEEEILGRNCRFLQGKSTNPATVLNIRQAIVSKCRFDGDILNYRKDGSEFWNRLAIGPLNRIKHDSLFVGLQFDVTERNSEHRRPLLH